MAVKDIRLMGSAASFVVMDERAAEEREGSESGLPCTNFNDLDIVFMVDFDFGAAAVKV